MHLGRVLSGGWLFFFLFLCCVMYVWVHIVVKCVHGVVCVCVCEGEGWGVVVVGGSIWRCACVWYCFLSTLKIFAFLWTLPVLPWLFPVCIRVFSRGDHTAQVTSHAAWRGGSWCSPEPASSSSLHSFNREEMRKESMGREERRGPICCCCSSATDSGWFSAMYRHKTQRIGMVSLWYMTPCDLFVCFGLWLNPMWTFKVTKKTPTTVSFVLSIVSCQYQSVFQSCHHSYITVGFFFSPWRYLWWQWWQQ